VPARSPECVRATAKSRWSAMKSRAGWRANVHMTHLMKMVEVKMMVEAIDENKARARTNK